MSIQKNLNFLLKKHHLNAHSLVSASDGVLKQPTTRRIVNGDGENLKDSTLSKYAEFFNVDFSVFKYGDLTDGEINNGIIVNGENINHGTQIGSQFNLNQNISAEEYKEKLSNEDSFSLKDMPLLDIDDGVLLAMYPETMIDKIKDSAERASTFIPHSGRTFGVKNAYDIHGVLPTMIAKNDILIVEPCIAPRDNDLVLICLDYLGLKRGLVARLSYDLTGHINIKYGEKEAEPMPPNSLVCGVIIEIKRRLLDNALMKSRLNPDWDIFSTLQIQQ